MSLTYEERNLLVRKLRAHAERLRRTYRLAGTPWLMEHAAQVIEGPAPAKRRDNAISICCENCGSRNVGRDATARWDANAQEWVLSGVQDGAWCDNCDDGDARLKEIPLIGEMT